MDMSPGGAEAARTGATLIRRLWERATAAPDYPATAADRRTVSLAGLELPVRTSAAIVVVTFAVLLDHSRTFLPADLPGHAPQTMRFIAVERFLLYGLVPLALVLLVFRDRPSRYGLTLGAWRWGVGLALAGCIVMTPIVLLFAQLPEARAYYSESVAPLPDLLITNALDLTAAEFAYRGFLTLTLVRVVGPVGVLLGTLPFVFAHLGKPSLEVLSTLGGGLAYGWLTWRTGSIVWGALAHIYILTLVTVASAW